MRQNTSTPVVPEPQVHPLSKTTIAMSTPSSVGRLSSVVVGRRCSVVGRRSTPKHRPRRVEQRRQRGASRAIPDEDSLVEACGGDPVAAGEDLRGVHGLTGARPARHARVCLRQCVSAAEFLNIPAALFL